MSTKPNILIFIDWFWPGYLAGGPVQSIVSLVNYLGNDFNFKIITTNKDLNSDVPYPGIESNKWVKSELNCEVYYAEPSTLNSASIKHIVDNVDFDKVYINSFFSKNFSIIPLQILNKYYKEKPIIFAPRGMLGEGALAIKRFKKTAFILYAKITGLHSRITWHATSLQEEGEIKKIINPKKTIHTISNLPKKVASGLTKEKRVNQLNLCFISRISEKKNLSFALEVLKELNSSDIVYSIYGPIEDPIYWDKCMKLIKELPPNVVAEYKGTVTPKDVEATLAKQHVMFLPTLNENFGHSIVESLLCGCPVIISDQTPWNDLEEYHAGYAINLNYKQKFADAILSYVRQNQSEFSETSERAIKYISGKINLKKITEQYKNLFNERIKN